MSRHKAPETDVLQGTLDLLILQILNLGSLHGYGIAQRLQQVTRDALQIRQGSLYPALYRLEKRGLLKSSWKEISGRDAKFYTLTRAGQRQLETEKSDWERLTAAVRLVLEASK